MEKFTKVVFIVSLVLVVLLLLGSAGILFTTTARLWGLIP